jgi:signal recognition particle subunit SEC65
MNTLLLQELGTFGSYPVMSMPNGRLELVSGSIIPHYRWEWSENLRRSIFTRQYEEIPVNGLIQLKRKELVVRATSAKRNHWVLVKGLLIVSPEEWAIHFPDMVYPGQVHWEEVTAGGKVVAFSEPTIEFTKAIIREIKKDREKALTLEEMENIYQKKEEARRKEELDDVMAELDKWNPIRPGMPGKRNHPTWQGIGIDLKKEAR